MTDNYNTPAPTSGNFDPKSELARLRAARCAKRRKRWQASRLNIHRAELVLLRRAGASLSEICEWLAERRVRVVRSTVARFLASLPELATTPIAEGSEHA